MKILKKILISGFSALFFYKLAALTAFVSVVKIVHDGSRITYSVNSREVVESSDISTGFSDLEIFAARSVYRTGLKSLQIKNAKGSVIYALPDPIDFQFDNSFLPLGDWWVDEKAANVSVWKMPIKLDPPFEISAVFWGRTFQSFALFLWRGDKAVEFSVRDGLLNRDLWIKMPGKESTTSMDLNPWPLNHLKHFVNFLSWACFYASLLTLVALLTRFFQIPQLRLFSGRIRRKTLARKPSSAIYRIAVWPILGIAAVNVVFIAVVVLQKIPHIPDCIAYVLQSKWLLSGHFTVDIPIIREYLNVPFTYFVNERWISQYPIGWPALLALGEAAGKPWLVAPVCGVLLVFMIYQLAKNQYDLKVAAISALLASTSPAFLMLCGSYMSHAWGGLLLCTATAFMMRSWQALELKNIAIGAFALGLLAAVRPLTFLAAACLFTFMVIWKCFIAAAPGWKIRICVQYVFFVFLGLIPTFIHNFFVTGVPWLYANDLVGAHSVKLSQWSVGLFQTDSNLAYLAATIFGWGWQLSEAGPFVNFAFAFAVLPFLNYKFSKNDLFLLALLFIVLVFYCFFDDTGLHGYGARYYFEVFFCIFILTARGMQVFIQASSLKTLCKIIIVGLVLSNLVTLRSRVMNFRGYNNVNSDLSEKVDKLPDRSLILFVKDDWQNWAKVARFLSPFLRSRVAFATSREDNKTLLNFYSGYKIYCIKDDEPSSCN